MKSSFIVFEGPDHCGKGTQIELLKKHLKDTNEDHNVIFTREPGGFSLPVCEKIRELLLDPDNQIDPVTEAYLYAASRAQHVNYIWNNLDEGAAVVCDRYYYSSLVYQGIVRGLGLYTINDLNKLAVRSIEPDLVFYLKIDMDTYTERRMKQKSLDRLERENLEFFEKVLNGYDEMFADPGVFPNKKRLITLDGRKSPDEIHDEIIKYIK